MNTPLTLTIAEALCVKYHHLQGTIYNADMHPQPVIECVCVAPYDELNKWIFVQFYKDCNSVSKSIANYHYTDYDVLLLVRTPDNEIAYEGLRQYMYRMQGLVG